MRVMPWISMLQFLVPQFQPFQIVEVRNSKVDAMPAPFSLVSFSYLKIWARVIHE
jgi:hypothetical protein